MNRWIQFPTSAASARSFSTKYASIKLIGEVWPDEAKYIVITRSAKFSGYKGMDPSDIPKYREGEREAKIRTFLEEEGVSCTKLGFEFHI